MAGQRWTLVAVVAVTLTLGQTGKGQVPDAAGTEPYRYAEGFETGPDPVRFWVSYDKKYTVNFKGLTEEKAYAGKQSFKLDVTFDESSRFLWQIPIEGAVPAAGALAFSGRLLVAEGTTGKATLGVSFRLPPTHHSGCTAPNTFYTSTEGEWVAIESDIVERGRHVANTVMGMFTADVKGENVGAFLERVIIDLRGEAGQRVVLYVDDLAIEGTVPSETAYGKVLKTRWAPVQQEFDASIVAWEKALQASSVALVSLDELSPEAVAIQQDTLKRVQALQDKVKTVRGRGHLTPAERAEITGFVEKLGYIVPNIRALSNRAIAGRAAVLYVVPPISSNRILPGDTMVCGTVANEMSIVACRGEYEPASFVVAARSDLGSLTVTASDLRGDGGTIPQSSIDIKAVTCWYQAGTAWVSIRQDKSHRLLTPELLLNDDALIRLDPEKQDNYLKLSFPDGPKTMWISDPTPVRSKAYPVDEFPVKDSPSLLPVNVPAKTNKQFWVTVRIPVTARAGVYAGTIRLADGNAAVDEIALEVHVLPFELLPPYYTSSMDYHGRLDPTGKGTISSWLKSRTQFRAELANMVAHGLRNCQHYGIRKDILGEVLKIRAEVGMDNRTLYLKNTIPIGNPTDAEALERIKRDVRDIIEFVKPYGTETVYFYGMDEQRSDVLTSQRPAWEAVREAGGKIFVAGYEENVDLMGDIQDMHVRAGRPSKEEVAKWHALGHRIFCYANPQTGVENPVVYRRNFGLLLWKYDYDGAATNAYQHTFGATWNDFDHTVYRAHTIAYPTADGVIDTIAWEGYREGVDDVRYVTTLQTAVAQALTSANPALKQRAVLAREYLNGLKAGMDIETGNLDGIRGEIIGHLIELTGLRTGE